MIEGKWKEVAPTDMTLGASHYAAAFDREGDDKMRAKHIVDKVLACKTVLTRVLVIQSQRNCVLGDKMEPESLRQDNTLWETEDDPNIIFFSQKHTHYSDLECKNGQTTMKKQGGRKLSMK